MTSFFGELRRRNVVKVAVAYAIVGWLLIEVSTTVLPVFEAPDWIAQVFTFFVILGFPLALILSWAYEITPEGIKLERDVAAGESITHVTGRKLDFAIIGALVLALGFVVYNYVLEDDDVAVGVLPNSVAVLPFENMSVDPEEAFYASGIHEEILNQLVKLSALNVIARTSMQQYANTDKSIPEIARELNVETVMEGSVRYSSGRIRITAQLNDGVTGAHLWSETYTRDFEDIFAIESDVAMNVANALEAEFSLEEQEAIEKKPTESPEAYENYLRALAATPASELYLFLLDQAIEADPDFALAYAARAVNGNYGLVGIGGLSPDEAAVLEGLVQADAEKAISLDPTLGIAHAALAVPHFVNWRAAEAEQAFRRAMELSPNDLNVLVLYGRFKRFRGEFDAAIQLARRAVELDPNNLNSLNQLAQNYRRSGDLEAASATYTEALNRGMTGVSVYAGAATVEALLGNPDEALKLLQIAEQLGQTGIRLAQMAHVYTIAGQPDDAKRLFVQFEQEVNENPVSDAIWIRALIAVGDYERARQRLESAVQNRILTDLLALTAIQANPWNDPELERPEFRRLVSDLWTDL